MSRSRTPGALVIGVGLRAATGAGELRSAVDTAIRDVLRRRGSGLGGAVLATVAHRAQHPALQAVADELGLDVRSYPSDHLALQPVRAGSAAVARQSGAPSVAEAAVRAEGAGDVLARVTTQRVAVVVGAPGADLSHHGDREVGHGLVDLAVNVRREAPPDWLAGVLMDALGDVAAYPDADAATAAVAERHGRPVDEVLLTSGAAEAFTLVARALRAGNDVQSAVVVHPQFTEPEQALRQAGHVVRRVLLRADDGFVLNPDEVPDEADLVCVGNPTNPTSVLHTEEALRALARPGRVLLVDEAFLDTVPAEPGTLAGARDVPGLLVVRSLTKTWGLAGLRAGYVLGDRDLVARLSAAQPAWSVSSLALAATTACCARRAVDQAGAAAEEGLRQAEATADLLAARGFHVVPPAAPFVLARHPEAAQLRTALRDKGFAVRRGDTFPGLGRQWIRVAARSEPVRAAFAAALDRCLAELPGGASPPLPASLDPLEVTPCP